MDWLSAGIGAVFFGPVWVIATGWILRRANRRDRRSVADLRQQEHLAELGALTGGLAHEIKNPLSTIKVNLQLLSEDLDSPGADERQKRWLRRLSGISGEVSRLQETLEDFLRFAGKHELRLSRVDLGTLVSDLTDFFAPQAQATGVRVRLSAPSEPVMVEVDVDLIKQALLNLMINAQQAMEDGGELILKVAREGRQAVVEVIDTGPGISDDVIARVFDAYYSTKPGGSGLGLPTARRILREHGGQMNLDTKPGVGTRFLLHLPLAD